MAESNVPPTLIRGTNNTGNASQNAGVTPSRLLLYTNSLRNDLQSRNLYTPNNIYPISEKAQAQQVINAIGGIVSIIAPFKSYNLKNTVYGRLLGIPTPLTEIGLAMLGKQFAMNAGSHIAQKNFPIIKVANLFDGSKKTTLFTKNVDLKITKKESATNFQSFLDAVIYYYPARDYPFKKNPTNADFIRNSGTGQLAFLFQAMNQNIYKEGFSGSPNDVALTQASEAADTTLTTKSTIIYGDNSNYRSYFNFLLTNPYSNIKPSPDSIDLANSDEMFADSTDSENTNPSQEYAPSQSYVKDNFGQTNKNNIGIQLNDYENSWVNEGDEFGDVLDNKIVWGRNSVSAKYNSDAVGTFGNVSSKITEDSNLSNDFNVRSGLLEYTRNLLNASEGALVDQTRKAFRKGQNVVGFNGSNLWVANQSKYAMYSNTAGQTGVRQHSPLDQYDRFAKAIRFNGNKVYEGNPNSVVFDRVTPRIHPTLNTDKTVNNRNLMLSIENLAVRVISKDGVGIIDDEYGSTIPVCEVGPFNGRQMWFPPYNMEINETSTATFDKTVMVGRNEPMYNYMYSERSATLSFTLLVDYPPQLKNLLYRGANKHKIISEFFAFGGNDYNPETVVTNPPQKIKLNNDHIKTITGPTDTAEPEDISPVVLTVSFPNDFPKEADVNTAIDTMYKTYQYEIEPGCKDAKGKISDLGMNSKVYVVTGTTGKSENKTLKLSLSEYGSASQYTLTSEKSQLNKEIKRIFENVANRHYYEIVIKGGASKLYTEQNPNDVKEEKDYNKKLGLRRARAVQKLVEDRIKAMFGQPPSQIGINIVLDQSTVPLTDTAGTTGSALAKQDNATAAAIDLNVTKAERYAEITIKRNSNTPIKKIPGLDLPDIDIVSQLKLDIAGVSKVEKQNSNNASQCIMEERKEDAAIQKGFQSFEDNYYNPVFHTQTPEDFHRRLTFLQQCMRQGAAKRYEMINENGILRAKNSVFGRQPICILRVGDFFYTKVVIENLTIDYADTTWDMNPEGFGMQPMIAKVTLQMKVLGGQSLKGPIDALQNAVTFNYYANSSFTSNGMYGRPSAEADNQQKYINGILTKEKDTLNDAYDKKFGSENK